VEDVDLSTLTAVLPGRVFEPGSDDYLAGARVSKGPGSPLAVVRPEDAVDVASVVAFARAHDLELSVRSGGHDSRGMSTNDGGLVLDLRSLDAIEIRGDLVTIGGGARWGQVADALAPHGLALSSGDTKTVGVGGLSLGGGVGWFVRLWGLAIDSLVSAEVVLADGRIVTANAESEPDLFWALRGGGGNFGVVTSFTYRAHPLPDGVVSGAIDLAPDADLAAAFRVWRDTLRAAPERLTTTYLGLPSFGEGMPPVSQIAFVWAGGDLDAARAAIAPLLEAPGVTGHTIERMPYADVLVDEQPDADQVGAPAIKLVDENGFAARFDDDLIAELAAVKRDLGDSVLMVRLLGGAYSRVAPDATAWGFRDTEAWLVSAAFVPEEIYDAESPKLRATWARLDPWLKGLYGNFSSLDDPIAKMYPSATLSRLRSIKAVYDPANFFHRNHNVKPA
jgi:FAD/FMN-containing dehydrogenase